MKGAARVVATGDPKRVDGLGYKVYKVDDVVRIDIDTDMINEEVVTSDNAKVAEGRAQQEQRHEEHGAV